MSIGQKPDIQMLGIDRDPKAISSLNSVKSELDYVKNRLKVFHKKFSKIAEIDLLPFGEPAGILFDLGYSTTQVNLI